MSHGEAQCTSSRATSADDGGRYVGQVRLERLESFPARSEVPPIKVIFASKRALRHGNDQCGAERIACFGGRVDSQPSDVGGNGSCVSSRPPRVQGAFHRLESLLHVLLPHRGVLQELQSALFRHRFRHRAATTTLAFDLTPSLTFVSKEGGVGAAAEERWT
eukprot:scaffold1440_cov332-Pavlova_lutheri.AAC.38